MQMTEQNHHRYTIDGIDDAGCAVLKREDGLTFPVPVDWLPKEAQVGQQVDVRLEASETEMTIRLVIAGVRG
jgi:hypothetical protein